MVAVVEPMLFREPGPAAAVVAVVVLQHLLGQHRHHLLLRVEEAVGRTLDWAAMPKRLDIMA
jgi:hypothetical protein